MSASLSKILTLSVSDILKNSIFEILTIPQISNINNQRITSAKSVSPDIVKKLIEYTLGNVYAHLFGDIAVRRLFGIMNLIMGYTEPKD